MLAGKRTGRTYLTNGWTWGEMSADEQLKN